jgi:hypothetical protein
MKQSNSRIIRLIFLCSLIGVCFCTCGIEDYIYLSPVQDGNINVRLTEQVTLRLPSTVSNESLYFTHFTIFYRIYISGIWESSAITTPQQMLSINQTLYNNYNSIYPSTTNTSGTVNTSVGSLFSTRGYHELELEDANIASVLDDGAQGKMLVINFPAQLNVRPSLTLGDTNTYTLYRSNGDGAFNPRPDRYFVNRDELNASAHANTKENADVVDQSGISGKRYAYISMYIAKVGREPNNLSNIYSSPAFVGILKLPDDS